MTSDPVNNYVLWQSLAVAALLALPSAWVVAAATLTPRWKVAGALMCATALPVAALLFYSGRSLETLTNSFPVAIALCTAAVSLVLMGVILSKASGKYGAKAAVAVLSVIGGFAWFVAGSLTISCRLGACL